jgi:hypothetical protein
LDFFTGIEAKRFAVLVRPKDVRLISVLRRRWHAGIGLAAVDMPPWPGPAVIAAVLLAPGCLANEGAALPRLVSAVRLAP